MPFPVGRFPLIKNACRYIKKSHEVMSSVSIREFTVTDDEVYLKKLGYNLGLTIGEGSYAKVKSGICEKDQKKVALKIINLRKAPKDFREKFLPREIKILKRVSHPNIITLFEILEFEQKVSKSGIQRC